MRMHSKFQIGDMFRDASRVGCCAKLERPEPAAPFIPFTK